MTLADVIYWPGDWLTANTTARQRLAVAVWTTMFWLGPGFALWLYWRDALWFVGFMSIVALWLTAVTMIGTETPVETEGNS